MLKAIVQGAFLITVNFSIYGSDSPIYTMEKENLLAAQQLGLISPDVAILKSHESRLRSRKRASAVVVFPLFSPRCSICSLRLKTHYGGEGKGERWCELNEMILKSSLTNSATVEQMEEWRKEQYEIEKE